VFEVHDHALVGTGEHRVFEIDAEIDPETVVRLEPDPFVALLQFDRLLDADEFLGDGLFVDPR
jgi:hypothetical protein